MAPICKVRNPFSRTRTHDVSVNISPAHAGGCPGSGVAMTSVIGHVGFIGAWASQVNKLNKWTKIWHHVTSEPFEWQWEN